MSKLSLHIGSEISLKDFSFSQLIIAVKNLFDTEGIPGLVKVLVVLIEQMLIRSGIQCLHCNSNHLHKRPISASLKISFSSTVYGYRAPIPIASRTL
jgi:hypothetical protein